MKRLRKAIQKDNKSIQGILNKLARKKNLMPEYPGLLHELISKFTLYEKDGGVIEWTAVSAVQEYMAKIRSDFVDFPGFPACNKIPRMLKFE